jgi:hypothetical protein
LAGSTTLFDSASRSSFLSFNTFLPIVVNKNLVIATTAHPAPPS